MSNKLLNLQDLYCICQKHIKHLLEIIHSKMCRDTDFCADYAFHTSVCQSDKQRNTHKHTCRYSMYI